MVRSKQVPAIFTKHCLKETHLARRKRARLPHGLRCEKRDSHRGEHDAVHGRCGSVIVWWQQWRSVHALSRTQGLRGQRAVSAACFQSFQGGVARGARAPWRASSRSRVVGRSTVGVGRGRKARKAPGMKTPKKGVFHI